MNYLNALCALILLQTLFFSGDKSTEGMPADKNENISQDDFEESNLGRCRILSSRLGTDIADVQVRRGSNQAHLKHQDFTEIKLEKVFSYFRELQFEFDMELGDSSEASSISDFYALARARFYFLNNDENVALGWVQYSLSSATLPSTFYESDMKVSIAEITFENQEFYNFSMNELKDQIEISKLVDSIGLSFLHIEVNGHITWKQTYG